MALARALACVVLLVTTAGGCGSGSAEAPGAGPPSKSPAGRPAAHRVIEYETGDEGIPQLWAVTEDAPGSQHQVATWPGGTNGLSRSPDGTLLATATLNGVDILNVDGSHRRQAIHLTGRSSPVGPVTWSPDSRRVAVPVQPAAIAVANVNGQNPRNITPGGSRPVWTPDGLHIAYTDSHRALNTTPADGTGTPVRLASRGSDPVWSPDGHRLAYVDGVTLVVADADGARAVRVGTGDPGRGMSWSPDSRVLAYTANGALTVVGAGGTDPHTLLTPQQAGDSGVCEAPPGTHCSIPMACPIWTSPARLAFQALEIMEIAPDGTGLTRLTKTAGPDLGVGCPFLLPATR